MSDCNHILLVESSDGASDKLAGRVRALGLEPVLVANLGEACVILEEGPLYITAALLPTSLPSRELKAAVKQLRKVGPASGIVMVSYGEAPTRDERKRLRSGGLSLALWDPIDDGTLRFQLNRALDGERLREVRGDPRVPTYLLARVVHAGRSKDAIVYSLASGGAFLETPRATMDGVDVDIEIRLPGHPVRTRAHVVFSNVPGNLQRPNLPLGMGVRFEDVASQDTKALRNYVVKRLEQLEV